MRRVLTDDSPLYPRFFVQMCRMVAGTARSMGIRIVR